MSFILLVLLIPISWVLVDLTAHVNGILQYVLIILHIITSSLQCCFLFIDSDFNIVQFTTLSSFVKPASENERKFNILTLSTAMDERATVSLGFIIRLIIIRQLALIVVSEHSLIHQCQQRKKKKTFCLLDLRQLLLIFCAFYHLYRFNRLNLEIFVISGFISPPSVVITVGINNNRSQIINAL